MITHADISNLPDSCKDDHLSCKGLLRTTETVINREMEGGTYELDRRDI